MTRLRNLRAVGQPSAIRLRDHAMRPLALAAALCFGTMGAAHAENLQSLYDAARAYDASFLSARALLDSAQFKADQAKALNLPSVGLGLTGARSTSDTPASSTTNSTTKSTSAALTASQSLYNAANSATIAQAEKGLEVSRADFEVAEQDLIVRVAQAYFDVLAAGDALATTRASKAAVAEQLASAKRNFEVGTATITDTREAQARFDLGTAQEIAAANDLLTKRIALDQLVGRNGVAPNKLAKPVVLPATVPANSEAWVASSETSHPQLRKARLALDVAKLETEKARASGMPTVGFSASYSRGYANSSGDAKVSTGAGSTIVPYSSSGQVNSTSLGVSLNLPLFAGYSIQNRIKETLQLEEKSRNDLDAARRGIALGTRQAFFGVQSGLAQVKALEAAESSSQLALEATQLGYKVGVRVNLDVLNSQTQLYSTQRDLAKARYDVVVGGLKLRQAAGVLKPEDVATVNALLEK